LAAISTINTKRETSTEPGILQRVLRGRKKMTSRYGAAISFVFKAQRRAHSRAYVTEAATQKNERKGK